MKAYYRIIHFTGLLALIATVAQSCSRKTAVTPSAEACSDTVTIHISRPVAPVSDLFWGTNFLYWVEDDLALSDGLIENALKELPCTVLRFPGGTVADNYHWKTNLLHNSNMFPYEEGESQSDFDEFMGFCQRINAEPLLVVNTQSWALKGDIEGGAKEAAEWVQYCKDKGYKVKYWEIGNETYWHPVMTAKEYGELVNVYAKAMKAVDPDIILSANGGWEIKMTGNKERTDPALWEEFRQGYLNASSVAEYKKIKEKADSAAVKPWTKGEDKWWYDLITTCGDNIDMISVHWYFFDNNVKNIDKKIAELKSYLKELKPNKDYPICLSEYNCNTPEPHLRITGLAESLGRFLNSGIDISCFWPLRIGGRKTLQNDRGMLALEDKDRQYPWKIYHLFHENIKGSMIECEHPEDLFTFASFDGRQLTVVLSGRNLEAERNVVIRLPKKFRRWEMEAKTYEVPEGKMALECHDAQTATAGKDIYIPVRSSSFTIITFKR